MYALGCVMYELLTGEPPFTPRQPLYALMRRRAEVPAPPAAAQGPDVPGRLADLVTSLLAKSTQDRLDARALAAALATSSASALIAEHTGRRRRGHRQRLTCQPGDGVYETDGGACVRRTTPPHTGSRV